MFRSLRLATCLAALCVACSGCDGPFLVIPGGELSGEVISERVNDWSFLEGDGIFELETRPEDPYSVQLSYFLRDGQVYIDPAEARTWLTYIRDDPRVRARFDGRVYPLRVVLVGQRGELEGFDRDRFIYRLEPRE